MAIVAHRGITARARDNSTEAIQQVAGAVTKGVPIGIEVDIRRSRDGLVLVHDETEGGVVIAEHTKAELDATLGAVSPLSLETGLDLMAPLQTVNLEIKDAGDTEEAVAAAQEHLKRYGKGYETMVISSFVVEVVAEIKQIDPAMPSSLLIDSDPMDVAIEASAVRERLHGHPTPGEYQDKAATMLALLDEVGADNIAPDWTLLSRELLGGLAARNKTLTAYTVNDEALLLDLCLRPEVAHVITDFPDIVFPELRSNGVHRKRVSPS